MPNPNLKTILTLDAVTCTAMFLLCVLAAATVAALLGLPAGVVTAAGWICLAAAMPMLIVAMQRAPSRGLTKLIAVGNLGWVAASLAVLAIFAGQMTWFGIAVTLVQALVVLEFALLEAKGAAALPRAAATA
ncbi:hypothetical protein [Sphingopyxis sp. NJF-3]